MLIISTDIEKIFADGTQGNLEKVPVILNKDSNLRITSIVLCSTQWSTAKLCAGFTTMHIQLPMHCTFLLFNRTFSLPLTIVLFFIERHVARRK